VVDALAEATAYTVVAVEFVLVYLGCLLGFQRPVDKRVVRCW
jgi:hypothetical protein